MTKCAELRMKELELDKKFKNFVNECRDPDEYFKRKAEFTKIKTKIGLGVNDMKRNCTKTECPSNFCLKLYDEIMQEVPKKE